MGIPVPDWETITAVSRSPGQKDIIQEWLPHHPQIPTIPFAVHGADPRPADTAPSLRLGFLSRNKANGQGVADDLHGLMLGLGPQAQIF